MVKTGQNVYAKRNNTIKASSVEMLTYCDIGMMVWITRMAQNLPPTVFEWPHSDVRANFQIRPNFAKANAGSGQRFNEQGEARL